MLSGPSLTNKQKAEVLLLSVWLWIVCSILLGKFIAPRGHERYLLSFIEFACGESMGNSQSIDLIVDPANQSEITDVSVLGFFFSFFFSWRSSCGLLSKDYMDICFPNSRVFCQSSFTLLFSARAFKQKQNMTCFLWRLKSADNNRILPLNVTSI